MAVHCKPVYQLETIPSTFLRCNYLTIKINIIHLVLSGKSCGYQLTILAWYFDSCSTHAWYSHAQMNNKKVVSKQEVYQNQSIIQKRMNTEQKSWLMNLVFAKWERLHSAPVVFDLDLNESLTPKWGWSHTFRAHEHEVGVIQNK